MGASFLVRQMRFLVGRRPERLFTALVVQPVRSGLLLSKGSTWEIWKPAIRPDRRPLPEPREGAADRREDGSRLRGFRCRRSNAWHGYEWLARRSRPSDLYGRRCTGLIGCCQYGRQCVIHQPRRELAPGSHHPACLKVKYTPWYNSWYGSESRPKDLVITGLGGCLRGSLLCYHPYVDSDLCALGDHPSSCLPGTSRVDDGISGLSRDMAQPMASAAGARDPGQSMTC